MANDQPDFCRTCADSLARVVQQEGIWPGLTTAGARMARRMAIEDGEVPTSATPCRCTRDSAWPTPSLRAGMTHSTPTEPHSGSGAR